MVSSPTDVVIVLTTLGAAADADAFARTLVQERLAACVNVLAPMRSTYRWKGNVEQDDERQVVIKTTRALLPQIEVRVGELHPFETPELVILEATASAAYAAWVGESTRP